MQERRQYKREILALYLHVFNTDSGKVLGYLGDVSTRGLMLISEERIETGQELPLGIRLEKLEADLLYENGEAEHIRCRGQSRWNSTLKLDLYGTGFMFLDISEQASAAIQKLVKKVGGCQFADALFHLDETLSRAQLQEVKTELCTQAGVTAVSVQADTPHLLVVQYNPCEVAPAAILVHIKEQGIAVQEVVL